MTNNSSVCPVVAGTPILAARTGRFVWLAGGWVTAGNWHARLRSYVSFRVNGVAVLQVRKVTEHTCREVKVSELLINIDEHFLERCKVVATIIIVVFNNFEAFSDP